jgi:hypothetical protein
MGNPVNEALDGVKDIERSVDKLIEHLVWYKEYISSEFVIPENSRPFVSRNTDIIRDTNNLTKSLDQFKQCTVTNDYSLTPEELVRKTLQTYAMYRYTGIL